MTWFPNKVYYEQYEQGHILIINFISFHVELKLNMSYRKFE